MTKKTEEFNVNGDDLLKKVKEIIAEGNVRRITVRDKSGKNLVELPLTVGVVGAVLAPILAAIGAIRNSSFGDRMHHSRRAFRRQIASSFSLLRNVECKQQLET